MGIVTSLASDKPYVEIKGREDGAQGLHIQGVGPEVNRPYGVAVDVGVPANLAEWVRNQPHTTKSESSPKKYVVMQASLREEDTIHVQVKGSSLNRPYGAVFEFVSSELADFISASHKENEEDEDEASCDCPSCKPTAKLV